MVDLEDAPEIAMLISPAPPVCHVVDQYPALRCPVVLINDLSPHPVGNKDNIVCVLAYCRNNTVSTVDASPDIIPVISPFIPEEVDWFGVDAYAKMELDRHKLLRHRNVNNPCQLASEESGVIRVLKDEDEAVADTHSRLGPLGDIPIGVSPPQDVDHRVDHENLLPRLEFRIVRHI